MSFCHPLRAAILVVSCAASLGSVSADDKYSPPASPRTTYNFNLDWRFQRAANADDTIIGFEAVDFDDAKWPSISTPHTFNDADSFRTIISHGGGDRGSFKGRGYYRKHFKLPESVKDGKVLLEFEGMRQAGEIFLNGKSIGLSENGVTAYGVDITKDAHFGDQENVLAVCVDNRTTYTEKATGTRYEWNTNDFNPSFGGLNRRVWLHVTGPIYQTLPVYDGLQTTGVYVYPTEISIADRTANIGVESQVHNASADRATVMLTTAVVDRDGKVCAKFDSEPLDMVSGEKSTIEASGPLTRARFWSVDDPYLYDVYTVLTVDDKIVDVNKITTGFRKTEFKGGVGTGGVYINDKFVWLCGFAQRASDEWAGLGQAYPDWMHDLNAQILRGCHGNYMRWMHVSPQRVDVEAYDRAGIVQVCPAGDKERDATGRQWEQRLEVMRDSMIFFRNSPSTLFWEAGNNGVTPEHMQQMVELRKQWDPHGGRIMGCRTLQGNNGADNEKNTQTAEYYGVMVGQDARTDQLKSPTDMFRAYSAERRDRAPLIETEDFRDEGARRFWDDFSPPYFGFKPGPQDTYHWNSETFAVAAARRYWDYCKNRISNTDPAHSKWSSYCSIYFFDSNADGRQQSSETCRVSGKVDAVRLPKEIYFTHRVMQSEKPDIHILAHWTYPADTKKTIYVISNTKPVELFLNGKSLGSVAEPEDGYIFAFRDIAFAPGTLSAVGGSGDATCKHELTTAGSPARIKLTPIVGPAGFQADGQDVVLFDVEVVDAEGRRCPTDDAQIDFTCEGPAIWRGGYNSGKTNSTNNLYVNTECGINRVAIRSTLTPGKITITARREGLESAKAEVESKPVKISDGLSTAEFARLPQR
jgi:beta-galactosidase